MRSALGNALLSVSQCGEAIHDDQPAFVRVAIWTNGDSRTSVGSRRMTRTGVRGLGSRGVPKIGSAH